MISSKNERPDFGWILDVLDELGSIPLPCLYYEPRKMFNLRGINQPAKHQLDKFLKEQIAVGTLQLSDADGNKIVDYAVEIDSANYIPPCDRKHSPRLERINGHERK